MLLLVCISIALEGANVCMNRHEGKLLVAQHETVTGVKLPASCLYHPVNLMPSVSPYPRIIVFIPNKKRGDFKINIYFKSIYVDTYIRKHGNIMKREIV